MTKANYRIVKYKSTLLMQFFKICEYRQYAHKHIKIRSLRKVGSKLNVGCFRGMGIGRGVQDTTCRFYLYTSVLRAFLFSRIKKSTFIIKHNKDNLFQLPFHMVVKSKTRKIQLEVCTLQSSKYFWNTTEMSPHKSQRKLNQ